MTCATSWRCSRRAASTRAASYWAAQPYQMKLSGTAPPISSNWSPPRSAAITYTTSIWRAAMYNRLAEAEIAMMPARSLASSASQAGSARSENGFARAVRRAAPGAEGIDPRLYIFSLCKELETTCLDRRGIDCLIDVDAGRLPEAICRMLGLIVCALVEDAIER